MQDFIFKLAFFINVHSDFIKEINGSEALLSELKALKDRDAVAGLLKKYGVSGTVDDLVKAFKTEPDGAIPDDAAENAAGGRYSLFDLDFPRNI